MKLLQGCILLYAMNAVFAIKAVERTTKYWESIRDNELEEAIKTFDFLNTNKAKNIILLVGDGMSLSTTTAGRIAIGQKMKKDGEEHVTSLDKMPHSGLLKTYSVNYQTPDSAATATAFLTGVKTNSGFLGVNALGGSCSRVPTNSVKSLLDYAAEEGKSTGVITTTRIQHATPAASYSHAHKRRFYSDKYATAYETTFKDMCPDISMQLFNKRRNIQVVMGGGRAHMLPRNVRDPEYTTQFGDRRDGRNLIDEWVTDMNEGNVARYVWNKTEFDTIDPEKTDYLLGLFSPFDTEYAINKRADKAGEPTLTEMTEKAIKVLRKNQKGFFLLVESGLIDKGHHEGKARYALEDFHELEKALGVARSLTNDEDTLIITTADHGHMFMIGGYSRRGNNVYGLAPFHTAPRRARDGKYYTSILYGNGPGHAAFRNPNSAKRQTINAKLVTQQWYQQQAAVPLPAETHSAEDVIVLGSGPMAHLLTGVHEQTHIASVVQFAACFGEKYKSEKHCTDEEGMVDHKLEERGMRSYRSSNVGELDEIVIDDYLF